MMSSHRVLIRYYSDYAIMIPRFLAIESRPWNHLETCA